MNHRLLVGIAGVFGVALIAAAAFTAARLLGATPRSALAGQGGPDGIHIHFIPATQVPTRQADVVGIIQSLSDNSLIVSPVSKTPAAGGPQVEILIQKDTLILRDSSLDHVPRPDHSQTLQQTVETIPLSQLPQERGVEIWGSRRGAGWIAAVIVAYDP